MTMQYRLPIDLFTTKIFSWINKIWWWTGLACIPLVTGAGFFYVTNLSSMLLNDAKKHYETENYSMAMRKIIGAENYLKFAGDKTQPKLACQLQVYKGAVFAHQHQAPAAIALLSAENIGDCREFPDVTAFAHGVIAQRSATLLSQTWQAYESQEYDLVFSHAEEAQPYLPYLEAADQQNLECQLTSLQGAALTHQGQPQTAIPTFVNAAQACESYPEMVDFAQEAMLARIQTLNHQAHQNYNSANYPWVLTQVAEAEPYLTHLDGATVAEQFCDFTSLKGATFYQTDAHDQAMPILTTAIAQCQPFQSSMQRAHLKRSHIYRQQADKLWSDKDFSESRNRYRHALTDWDGYRHHGGSFDAQALMERSTVKFRLADLEGSIRDYGEALTLNGNIVSDFYPSSSFQYFDALRQTPPNLADLLEQLKKQSVRLSVAQLPNNRAGTFHYQFSYWTHNHQIFNPSVAITVDVYKHDDFLEFIDTLQHEAIHVAQTCKANHGRPYGFNSAAIIHPEYNTPFSESLENHSLEQFIQANYSDDQVAIEREAYVLASQPNVALEMIQKYCK